MRANVQNCKKSKIRKIFARTNISNVNKRKISANTNTYYDSERKTQRKTTAFL